MHERPAVLELAGGVDGLDVADLGCGGGHFAAILSTAVAHVTGVEGREVLVGIAARSAPEAAIARHDLDRPFAFLAGNSQCEVVCVLVIYHLSDRPCFWAEVHRILRPGGRLGLSTTYPTADWSFFGGSCFDERWVPTIEYPHMTMSTLVYELVEARFVLERMIEPQWDEAMRTIEPERYEKLPA